MIDKKMDFQQELENKTQKEIVFNKLLPYYSCIDKESTEALKSIKLNLCKAVLLRDIRPGVSFYAGELMRYLRLYGLKFTKEDHILFVKVFYEQVITPDLEGILIEKFVGLLNTLLKKRELLSRNDLVLDWEPLYALCERQMYSKNEPMGLEYISPTMEGKMKKLVKICRPFFPPNCTQSMLDEWRPLLCPYDIVMSKASTYLVMFLPTQLVDQSESELSWKLWINEFLSLWVSAKNGPSWEKHFVNLFGRLAHNNIGHIDWSPYVNTIFTRLLRSLQLPVGKLQHTTALAQAIPIDSSCRLIINMLGGATTPLILSNLKNLVSATETFYHPSNLGKWTTQLLTFIQHITTLFVSRLHRERYKSEEQKWEPPVPESHRIKDTDVTEFVEILLPVTLLSLYGKTGAIVSSQVLHHLAYLAPNLIMPVVLEKLYVALESITEPHQVRACLTSLCCTLRAGLHGYKDMKEHILPLLFQCLPGIDLNDLPKSAVCFQFISTCMTLVPAVDCSESAKGLSESEKELCFSTARFEDFVLQFYQRCFLMLDSLNLDESHGTTASEDSKASHSENITGLLLINTAGVVAKRCSPKIFAQIVDTFFRFTTTNLLDGSTAMSTLTKMIAAISRINTKHVYSIFIPYYSSALLAYFSENPDAKSEEKIDKQFLWDITILKEVCHASSKDLLLYKDEIFKVAHHALEMTAKQGYQCGVNLLKHCVTGWSTFYNIEGLVFSDDPKYCYIKDWGKTMKPDEVNLKWHIPSVEELECCFDVLDQFLKPSLDKLRRFNRHETELSKEDLLKTLTIVKGLIAACSLLLPTDNSNIVSLTQSSSLELTKFEVSTIETLPYYGSVLAKKSRRNIRSDVFSTTDDTLSKMLEQNTDDISSILVVMEIFGHCSLMMIQEKSNLDQHWKLYQVCKVVIQNPLRRNKERDLSTITDRAVLQHEVRNLAINRYSYTQERHTSMLRFIQLSTFHYMKVREAAQGYFFHGLTFMPKMGYELYLPLILKNLDSSNPTSHQQFKGALYLLCGKTRSRVFLGFYQKLDVMAKVWPALINAPHSDKLSVTKLYEKLAMKIQVYFDTVGILNPTSTASIKLAENALKSCDYEVTISSLINEGYNHNEKTIAENLGHYTCLVNDLADALASGKLTWKHTELVLGMLSLMLRHDVDLPSRVTKIFVDATVNDTVSVRTLGIACLASIMKKIKRKHAVVMKNSVELLEGGFYPGDRDDNSWHQYDANTLPLDEESFNGAVFVDKTHWGYYAWPKKLKTYAPYSQQPPLDRSREVLTENEKIVFDAFADQSYVDKLVSFLCLENEKGKDKFDTKRMDMFRGLFRNFGDAFVPNFRAHIERLAADKSESNQRCAAELIAGLVMGAKHWPYTKLASMWEWLIPTLRSAVANISQDTMKDWDQLFSHIVQNRDPRRIYWVLDFLAKEPERQSKSVLVEASKLYVLQGGIHQQEWRVPKLLHKIVEHVEPILGHPYKTIRNRIGSVLASVFLYDIRLCGREQKVVRTPLIRDFVAKVVPQLEILLSEDTPPLSTASSEGSPCLDAPETSGLHSFEQISLPIELSTKNLPPDVAISTLEDLQSRLKEMLPPGSDITNLIQNHVSAKSRSEEVRIPVEDPTEMQIDTDNDRTQAIRVFKTIMKWIVSSQRSTLQPFNINYLQVLPLLCKMYPIVKLGADDEELHQDVRLSISCIAQSFVDEDHLLMVATTIQEISQSPSWHSRHSVLAYIQVFVYTNLFSVRSCTDCVSLIQDTVLLLLEDTRHDVSQMASVTLSGLIQCGVFKLDDNLLKRARDLIKTKLKRKKNENSDPGFQKRLLKRHAGVLTLSACVLSAPYSVPDWMPNVVMQLSDHLHDPQPIHETIKKTLSQFRRTHHDNWHVDKLKFTSDELSVLTDLLVSPSYYA